MAASAFENAGTAGIARTAFLSLFAAFTQEDGAAIISDSPAPLVPRGNDRAASDGHQGACQEPPPPAADPQNDAPPLPVFSFPLLMALPVADAAPQPEAEGESLAPIPSAVSPAGNSEADGSTYRAVLHDQARLPGANTQISAGESRPVETIAQPLLEFNAPRHDWAVSDAGPTDPEELPSADILPPDPERVKRERPATDQAAVLPVAVRQVPDPPAVTRVEPAAARAAASQTPAPEAPTREGVAVRESLEVTAPHLAGTKTMNAAFPAPLAFAARLAERGRDDVRYATQQRGLLGSPVESEPPGIAGDVIPRVEFAPLNRPESPRVLVSQTATEPEPSPQADTMLDGAGTRSSRRTKAVISTEPVPQEGSGTEAPKHQPATIEKPALKREEPAIKSARTASMAAEAPPAIANESRTPTQPVRNSMDAPSTPRDMNTVSEPDPAAARTTNEHASASRTPAREISMRVTAPESSGVKVDIKLVDRAGSVHVAVRAADVGVAETLQSGLAELVQRLEHKGFAAETWSPVRDSSRNVVSDVNQSGDAGQDSGRAPRDGSQREHEGGQQGGRNRPRWVAELEQSLEGRR